MISRKDIKDIVIFKHLTDDMIKKLLPEMELLRFPGQKPQLLVTDELRPAETKSAIAMAYLPLAGEE